MAGNFRGEHLKDSWHALQITFAYIGTVVGAGFATGQEILQFFSQFGWIATVTISLATILFVWCGARLMLISYSIKATSYEDLNIHLFGERWGRWMSLITLVILLAVTGVMLAGAGAIFEEQLKWSYQLGLWLTMGLTFIILKNGMAAILSINSLVVPMMIMFAFIIIEATVSAPLTSRWLSIESDHSIWIALLAPLLYVSFNLWMAQAVLVPLGASIKKRRTILWGSIGGGIGIGLLIWVAHFAISPLMPGIRQFDIPMIRVIIDHGWIVQFLFLLILFSEIFTTLIANVFGLCLQLQARLQWRRRYISVMILIVCYAISQFGFKELLSFLYPLFGLMGLLWFFQLIRSSADKHSSH